MAEEEQTSGERVVELIDGKVFATSDEIREYARTTRAALSRKAEAGNDMTELDERSLVPVIALEALAATKDELAALRREFDAFKSGRR